MLVDCFTFFNELDMLESRLAYLNEKVDLFVLVEADITHSGKSKPYYFEQNKDRYQKYLHKILHIKLTIDPNQYDWNYREELGFNNASWQVENRQRNGILIGLEQLVDDDIVMISDLDEIPDSSAINRAINLLQQKNILVFETGQFLYNLGQRLVEPWPGTVITYNRLAKSLTPQKLRDRKNLLPRILKGGWHLTYFANIEQIQTKITSFAHQEYNSEQFTDNKYIEQQMVAGQDLYGRSFPMQQVNLNDFPRDFLKHFEKYRSHNKKLNFIQIGAGAGDLDPRMNNRDGFTEYVKRLDKSKINLIVLVEPNPLNIPKLTECWKDYPQVKILNIGICTKNTEDKNIEFYYTDADAPHYQVFSMEPSHVKKHYPYEPLKSIKVPCMTLEELIETTTNSEQIEILALDIEGIDAKVIMDTDWQKLNCNYVSFEFIHLGNREQEVTNRFYESKYKFIGKGLDHNGYDWMFQKI